MNEYKAILEILQNDDYDTRITYGDRWITWGTGRMWIVYERVRYKHNTTIIGKYESLGKALKILTGNESA